MTNTKINFVRENDQGQIEEEWILIRDTRHGKYGFRAIRYERVFFKFGPLISKLKWDEHYMFFESLDAAEEAFKVGNLKQGRANF